jgi:hypothetical protein
MRPGAVPEELDRAVAAARPIAAALAVASAVLAGVGAAAPWHRLYVVHVAGDAAAAVSFLAIAALLRRRPVPQGRGHAVLAGLAAVVLAEATLALAIEQPDETVPFIPVVTGAGALFLSRAWLAAVLAAAWACWLSVAAARGASAPAEWAGFGAYLLAATGLALVVHRERLRAAAELVARSAEAAAAAARLRAVFEASPSRSSAPTSGAP